MLKVRTVPRKQPLGSPWDSDVITLQVDSEAAYTTKNGPMERVGSVDYYGTKDGVPQFGWTLYSRGDGSRYETREAAAAALARAFGFTDTDPS